MSTKGHSKLSSVKKPHGGFVISIVGPKDGLGKSSFAVNFALSVALERKLDVALLDADPGAMGDAHLLMGMKKVEKFGDKILQGKIRDIKNIKAELTKVNVNQSEAYVYTQQMYSNSEALLKEDPEKVELYIKQFKRAFPVTIVDVGCDLSDAALKFLDLSDLILVVTNPDLLILNHTKRFLDKLQTHLYPQQITKLIVNRAIEGNPYSVKFIEETLRRQVFSYLPEDEKAFAASIAKGVPYFLNFSKSSYSQNLINLNKILFEQGILEKLSFWVAKMNRPNRKSEKEIQFGEKRVKGPKKIQNPRSLFKSKVHLQLIEKLDLKKEQLDRNLSVEKKNELRDRSLKIVTEIMNQEDHPWKSRNEMRSLAKEILDEALALGPLEDLLSDPGVTEIMVNRSDQIYVEKDGHNKLMTTTFTNDSQLLAVIERIVNPLGRRIDEKTPYVDARLADGSRVHAIIPPLALDGPMLTIRKFPTKRLGPKDLINFKSVTPEMSDFLQACIEARLNVLISGGTGSGKTTLLNILSNFIPNGERILTVEDAAELQLNQPHVGRLETRPPNIEGTGAVTIRDLVKQTLRMKPDRIVVGEVRGGEALDMLQAMNTGHDGSMATIHSNTPTDCLSRLETLVMMAGMDLPIKAIRDQISSAVHLVVQQSRLSDGSRKVTYITEVVGMQGDKIITQDIFKFKQKGLDEKRKVIGGHSATGFMPSFISRIEAMGVKLPRGMFKAA